MKKLIMCKSLTWRSWFIGFLFMEFIILGSCMNAVGRNGKEENTHQNQRRNARRSRQRAVKYVDLTKEELTQKFLAESIVHIRRLCTSRNISFSGAQSIYEQIECLPYGARKQLIENTGNILNDDSRLHAFEELVNNLKKIIKNNKKKIENREEQIKAYKEISEAQQGWIAADKELIAVQKNCIASCVERIADQDIYNKKLYELLKDSSQQIGDLQGENRVLNCKIAMQHITFTCVVTIILLILLQDPIKQAIRALIKDPKTFFATIWGWVPSAVHQADNFADTCLDYATSLRDIFYDSENPEKSWQANPTCKLVGIVAPIAVFAAGAYVCSERDKIASAGNKLKNLWLKRAAQTNHDSDDGA